MTRLSVNINKVATLRNARGGNNPSVIQVAIDAEKFGAEGITVHPRPDERHITYQDALALKDVVTTEYNVEGYPDMRFLRILKETRPAQATLVPDTPQVITSNAGWQTIEHYDFLKSVVSEIKGMGIRVSIFVDPNAEIVEAAKSVGTDRVELYTEPYASAYSVNPDEAIAPYIEASKKAKELGLGINAGHDLSLDNLKFLVDKIPHIDEVSIGHALVCDALYYGLENTIQMYLKLLK